MATAQAPAPLMIGNPFKKVTRAKAKLRLALDGPAGSGKSYTALRFAHALAKCIQETEGREATIAAIDTENGSLAKYAGEVVDDIRWDWSGIDLQDFSPTSYAALIKIAEQAGFDILIIDSLSHAWSGSGGALDLVDKKKAAGKNAFTDGWREVTPMHNALIDTIVRSSCHVIATMRTKTEWVLEKDEKGRTVPRKIGMAPIQRAGMEYEFDIVGDIDQETHTLTVSKSRFSGIDNAQIVKPGFSFFVPIWHWLNNGSDVPREVLDAAAFKTKEEPMSPLERARKKAAAKKPDEQPAATTPEAAPQNVQHVDEATRQRILTVAADVWPERAELIAGLGKLLAEFNAKAILDLSPSDALGLESRLLGLKSQAMQERADAKLAASATTATVDCEQNLKPAATPPAAAPEATTEAAAADAPSADDRPDSAELSNEPGTATKQQLAHCDDLAKRLNWTHEKQLEWLKRINCNSFRNLSEVQAAELTQKLEARLAATSN